MALTLSATETIKILANAGGSMTLSGVAKGAATMESGKATELVTMVRSASAELT